jgi:hypothetical protein
MSKNTIDQTNDSGYAVLRTLVSHFPKLGDIAKTANIDDDEFLKLSADSFAWPSERRFPIYNKEQTALSLGYRKMAKEVPAEVDVLLQKAAEVYEIPQDILDTPQEKVATTNEYWLLQEKKRFRVASAPDVKIAETVLREKYAQLSVEDRAEAYYRLGKVAEELSVTLAPATYKLAGFTITSTQVLKDWLEARKEAAEGTGLGDAYAKLAADYTNVPPFMYDHVSQVKLASAIGTLDKEAGLDKYYGKTLPDPLQTVFNTDKMRRDQVKVGTDFGVDNATFSALPLTFWEDILGPEIAKEIAPDGEIDTEVLSQVLATLPMELKAIVQKQLTGQP